MEILNDFIEFLCKISRECYRKELFGKFWENPEASWKFEKIFKLLEFFRKFKKNIDVIMIKVQENFVLIFSNFEETLSRF